MSQQQHITVTECTIKFTGAHIIEIINALEERPHRIAKPILASIESQLAAQFAPQSTPPTLEEK